MLFIAFAKVVRRNIVMAVINNKEKNMPQTLEDGTEVYSQAEVDAQMEERLAEEREKLETKKDSEILAKEEELALTKEALEKLQKKDMNFENLRKSKTLTPEQEAEAKKNADELEAIKSNMIAMSETLTQVQKQPLEAAKAQFIANNIGSDKDLAEKFEHFYSKLGSDATTVEQVNEAIKASFAAATGGARQPDFTGRTVRTGVTDNFAGTNDGKIESEDSQNFGTLLGLKVEDKKTYSSSVKDGVVPAFTQTPTKDK